MPATNTGVAGSIAAPAELHRMVSSPFGQTIEFDKRVPVFLLRKRTVLSTTIPLIIPAAAEGEGLTSAISIAQMRAPQFAMYFDFDR